MWTDLDREVVFDLVQRAGRCEAGHCVHGEFLFGARQHSIAVSQFSGREYQSQVGEVSGFRHFRLNDLDLFGYTINLFRWLVAFGVPGNLLLD